MTKNITTSQYFKGFRIQASESLPCREDILEAIYEVFEKTVFKRRTFFMRFDVKFPKYRQYPADNKLFIGFQASFMKHLRRKGYKPAMLWVRENNIKTGPNQHYHCFLCLSGRETNSIYGHLKKAEELWELALGLQPGEGRGLIDYCDREDAGVMVNYRDIQSVQKCFYWASYLSKTRTKEYLPGIRTVGRSLF